MINQDSNGNEIASLMERILYEVKKVIVGQDRFLERVLVAVSPSPVSGKLVRAAKRMATGLHADLIAAYENTGPIPAVINLSYGTIAGPHDGTGALEAAIDQRIAAHVETEGDDE
jgi:hypothetical protein